MKFRYVWSSSRPKGLSGGLAMLWKKEVDVSLVNLSHNHIDVRVSSDRGVWRCTGFYGEPKASRRRDFRNVVSDVGLVDLGYSGVKYTWCNNRERPYTVRSRLDRAFADHAWRSLFPRAAVQHLESVYSDHQPILLWLEGQAIIRQHSGSKLFRFKAFWSRAEDCERVIHENWHHDGGEREGAWGKIQSCRAGLKAWSRKQFGNVKKQLKTELEGVLNDKATKWRQRGKAHWLAEGDRNTKFFHCKATSRMRRNQIFSLKDDSGIWREKPDEVQEIISSYFQRLFTPNELNIQELHTVLDVIQPRVTDATNEELICPFLAEEVSFSLSQMFPYKSPGPDGLPPLFFQRYWKIVSVDVTRCVLDILNHNRLLPDLNFTNIVLISKVKCPTNMTHFRPISLCNVVYKLASKCIANRLGPCLDGIISPSQSAFIKGRLITDNVLLAYEVNHFLRKQRGGKVGHFALKLDMSKAYDRVEWVFLEHTLKRLGFHERFVSLVMLCVSTCSFSFLLNGRQFGWLKPGRGLKQGDPLSPHLFIICAEVFSRLVKAAELSGRIMGVAVARGAPRISHLLFADDSLIFGKATTGEAQCIREILERYERVSGQQINLQKSELLFNTSTDMEDREAISSILNVQVVDTFQKYLGLPTVVGRSKKKVFQSIRDRVWKRIFGWNEHLLSQAGKDVLIKAVLQAIPTYAMSCFRLPDRLIKEFESGFAEFRWSSPAERKIHWVAWSALCTTIHEGGLGFRDLKSFNLAMLAKQGWRILSSPESLLSRVLKAKYFSQVDFLNAKVGHNPSFTWRSICAAMEIIKAGCRWRIGDGGAVQIWKDAWLPRPVTFRPTTPLNSLSEDALVSNLLLPGTSQWNETLIRQVFNWEDAILILGIPLSAGQYPDRRIWHYTKDGRFSVKSAYHLHRRLVAQNGGAAATSEQASNLTKRRVPNVEGCPVCLGGNEDIKHAMICCDIARQTWALSSLPWHVVGQWLGDALDWLRRLAAELNTDQLALGGVVAWAIWSNRNKMRFEGEGQSPMAVFTFAQSYLNSFQSASQCSAHQTIGHERSRWCRPTTGVLKINFDAAIFAQAGAAGLGVVVRDDAGVCVYWKVRSIPFVVNAELAEAWALRLAVEVAGLFPGFVGMQM
ncbi:UNVERIFIED_CONTAM: putative mitochondrial protein [Sesamum latifolium]|uniref:Mitochondrial protein n=1 Tax=Sesamum latifolium TaxID=2727402 RepID=A0AAW2WSY5_9LAMI